MAGLSLLWLDSAVQIKKSGKRMNFLKCKQGFVRMMNRDKVYDALLEVLPKKQKAQLICAKRRMGFEGQGHIISYSGIPVVLFSPGR